MMRERKCAVFEPLTDETQALKYKLVTLPPANTIHTIDQTWTTKYYT